jgi:hypothetical protein
MIHKVSIIHAYFFERYSSILAFFFDGESSFAHALSFNPTTTLNTFFTLLRNILYPTDSLSKASSENSMLNGNLLPCENFPEVYSRKASPEP